MIKINDNALLYTFELAYKEFKGSTNVFCYIGDKFIFICDTFVYPKEMGKIKNYLKDKYPEKMLIVFNSHSDFDHFWGNNAFKDDIIISTCKAKENMMKNDYTEESLYFTMPSLIFPNVCFKKKIFFNKENVEFFYSPGHTDDSASCFFAKEKILFAGDNLEYPHPYIDINFLDNHIKTLLFYKKLDPKIIIPGHGEVSFDKKIIDDNLLYLQEMKNGK